MTHEQIAAARAHDYRILGRFLGLADMTACPKIWSLTPTRIREMLADILAEYKIGPITPEPLIGSKYAPDTDQENAATPETV